MHNLLFSIVVVVGGGFVQEKMAKPVKVCSFLCSSWEAITTFYFDCLSKIPGCMWFVSLTGLVRWTGWNQFRLECFITLSVSWYESQSQRYKKNKTSSFCHHFLIFAHRNHLLIECFLNVQHCFMKILPHGRALFNHFSTVLWLCEGYWILSFWKELLGYSCFFVFLNKRVNLCTHHARTLRGRLFFSFFKLDSQTCSGVLVRRVFALKGISKSRPQRSRSVLIKEHQISTASFSFSQLSPSPSPLCSALLCKLDRFLHSALYFTRSLSAKAPLGCAGFSLRAPNKVATVSLADFLFAEFAGPPSYAHPRITSVLRKEDPFLKKKKKKMPTQFITLTPFFK